MWLIWTRSKNEGLFEVTVKIKNYFVESMAEVGVQCFSSGHYHVFERLLPSD